MIIPGTLTITSKIVPAYMLNSATIPARAVQSEYTVHIKPLARLYETMSVISSALTLLPLPDCLIMHEPFFI